MTCIGYKTIPHITSKRLELLFVTMVSTATNVCSLQHCSSKELPLQVQIPMTYSSAVQKCLEESISKAKFTGSYRNTPRIFLQASYLILGLQEVTYIQCKSLYTPVSIQSKR